MKCQMLEGRQTFLSSSKGGEGSPGELPTPPPISSRKNPATDEKDINL